MTPVILTFTGAHGTGKTTICEILARKTDMVFFPSKAARIHEMFGVTASEDLAHWQRLRIQEAILENWLNQYADARKMAMGAVFDRCPLDFAAYMLADVRRETGDSAFSTQVRAYIERCIEACSNLEYILLCTPHGATLGARGVEKPAVENVAYMDHVQLLIIGLLNRYGLRYVIVPDGTPEQRIDAIGRYLQKRFNEQAIQAQGVQQVAEQGAAEAGIPAVQG